MANARRKPDEEPVVRSAAGSRLARGRMMQVATSLEESSSLEAPSCLEVPGIVLPMRSSGILPDEEFATDWLGAAKPEVDLRFSRPAHDLKVRTYPSRSMLLSVLAHASLLAIAMFAFPKAAEFQAGGETAIPIEMVIVAPDSTDAAVAESGAKPQAIDVSIPLPEQAAEAVVIALPEVVVLPPDTAPPVRIEAPEPPAPGVQQAEPLPPAPVAPDGILPPQIAPAERPVPPKPRPVVDQDRIRRDALAAREVRRQEQLQKRRDEQKEALREEQRQAQIAERRKQQAQRAVVDAQRHASAEATQPAPSPQRTDAQRRGETGAGTEQITRQARQAGGGGQGAAASAGTAEIANYRTRILAHLARYKTYPESAQDAGIQGRATVSFTITRTGGVTSASLAGSSGAGVLDQATLAMVRRAQPFPAMPPGGPASMSFTAVIRYDLR
jgi:periplasmic protein TonB